MPDLLRIPLQLGLEVKDPLPDFLSSHPRLSFRLKPDARIKKQNKSLVGDTFPRRYLITLSFAFPVLVHKENYHHTQDADLEIDDIKDLELEHLD